MPPLPAAARFSDRTLLLLPLGLIFAAGCGGTETSSPLSWELDDGRTLAERIAGQEAAAVLVIDPNECLQCQSVLATWMKERARRDGRMFLLFTRRLRGKEQRYLRAAGIRADGYVREGGPRPQDTPVEIAFRDGDPVYRAIHVYGPRSPLLKRLQQETLEQFVASPPTETADPQPAYDLERSRE